MNSFLLSFFISIFGSLAVASYQYELPMMHHHFNDLELLRRDYERRRQERFEVSEGFVHEYQHESPPEGESESESLSLEYASIDYLDINIEAQSWSYRSLYLALKGIFANPHFDIDNKNGMLLERSSCIISSFCQKIEKFYDELSDSSPENLTSELSATLEEFHLLFLNYKMDSEFWVFFWIVYCSKDKMKDLNDFQILLSGNNYLDVFKDIIPKIQKLVDGINTICTRPEDRLIKANFTALLEQFQKYRLIYSSPD